jgi:hypothetical protein
MNDELPDDERARLFAYYAGPASALEDAAADFRERAGKCFMVGKDAAADFWREAAKILEERAKNERKTQSKYHPDKAKRTQ